MAHPSRDEPLNRGDFTPSGQGVLLDQHEDSARARQVGFPSGHAALGNRGHDPDTNASRLRTSTGGFGNRLPDAYEQLANVAKSRVPTQDLARNRGDIDLHVGEIGKQFAGYYREGTRSTFPLTGVDPEVAVSSRGDNRRDTVIHEIGHAQHYDKTTFNERENPNRSYADTHGIRGGNAPDPLKEGVADGYVDRYAGPNSPTVQEAQAGRDLGVDNGAFGHFDSQYHGYSTQYEAEHGDQAAWSNTDRALYAGTRAHFSETGENPTYQSQQNRNATGSVSDRFDGHVSGVNSVTDATLHHLSQSPHAQQAWKDTHPSPNGLSGATLADTAGQASRRHKDRKLLSEGQFTQGGLFNELRTEPNHGGEHLGYTTNPDAAAPGKDMDAIEEMRGFDGERDIAWPHSMEKNQFGEAPRRRSDIQSSLAIPKHLASRYTRPGPAPFNSGGQMIGTIATNDRKDIR